MARKQPRVFAYVSNKKHHAFKVACAVLGYSSQEILETAVDDAIRRVAQMDLTEMLADALVPDLDVDLLLATLAEAQAEMEAKLE